MDEHIQSQTLKALDTWIPFLWKRFHLPIAIAILCLVFISGTAPWQWKILDCFTCSFCRAGLHREMWWNFWEPTVVVSDCLALLVCLDWLCGDQILSTNRWLKIAQAQRNIKIWKKKQIAGWTVITRCFALGFVKYIYAPISKISFASDAVQKWIFVWGLWIERCN